MKLKYIFGPVNSRRLGKSLGIDLIPYKTCPLDCIYCECGQTNKLTLERREYVPTDKLIMELDKYLSKEPDLDYISFAGSGEPTLDKNIGKVIKFIKDKYPKYQLALITNAVLLKDNKVIDEIKDVDLIIPSLDAVSETVFRKINRPIDKVKASDIITGLKQLRTKYQGKIFLEIFIIPGINDNIEELELFIKAIDSIKPEKIQLNRLDRPGTEKWVKSAAKEELATIAEYISRNLDINIEIL